ncbi:hypothetical protein K3495_g13803 [Podosphaera aphanis]|nr:hypothetical protein K3495_g13803 [Podosphaera aphanis]
MPQGFEQKGKVIKLEKGLYGLKQAAALWHDNAKSELQKNGLKPTESDICLFSDPKKDLFAILHVDDFQILGPNKDKIKKLAKVCEYWRFGMAIWKYSVSRDKTSAKP